VTERGVWAWTLPPVLPTDRTITIRFRFKDDPQDYFRLTPPETTSHASK
jgi:hypothetical protein